MTLLMMAIDPGDTTGFWHTAGAHAQISGWNAASYIHGMLSKDIPVDVVIIERMNIRDKRIKVASESVQMGLNIIGVTRYFCMLYDIPLIEQWNADKNKVSDAALEAEGMLLKPKTKWRHANDAARHAYFYMQKLKKKGEW